MKVNSNIEPEEVEVKRVKRSGDTYVDLLVRWDIQSQQVEDIDGETRTMYNYHEEQIGKQLHGEKTDQEIQALIDTHRVRLIAEAQSKEEQRHENKHIEAPDISWVRVEEFNVGAEKPLKVSREYKGETYSFWCYVTQDIVDAYQAGNLSVGDYVSLVFVDADKGKPLVMQKIYKTW